jgi:hypothetical protein
MKIVVNA